MAFTTMQVRILGSAATLLLAAMTMGVRAQGLAAAPIKQGLWETTITSNMQIELPPELQARIAAMTPQQQAMMKANMGGKGGAPLVNTTQSCAASQESLDSLVNQAQKDKGTKCTFTNRTQTANGASFDVSCTMQEGAAQGHSDFQMADSEHVTGKTHMTMRMNGSDGPGSATIDSTLTSKYMGTNCGSVKPNTTVSVPR
jgi:hypothetical protein